MEAGHSLAVAALVSWLITEALGAIMVRGWIASGGAREARRRPPRPDAMSVPVLAGHAGLNAAGLLSWIIFVSAGPKPAAWIALGLMAPAIGLGISTVTIWTPYPGPRHQGQPAVTGSAAAQLSRVLPDELVRRALEDEQLTRSLVEGLLDRNLATAPARAAAWNLRPLIPISHGVLAIATFVLAVLAAVAAG
jgi:hypothetical protein